MAVGEEASLLPTQMSGAARVSRPPQQRRIAVVALMCVMGCALVGTLSHVSAGARYYGTLAAHKEAAATQQLFEYYNQLMDRTAGTVEANAAEHTALKADPLVIQQLDEVDDQPPTQELATATAVKDTLEGEGEEIREPEDGASTDAEEQELDAQIASLEKMGADGDDDDDAKPQETQQLAQISANANDAVDDDLATHEQSLLVLQQMMANTQKAIDDHKHKMLVKDVVREVLAALPQQQRTASVSEETDEAASTHAEAMGMLEGLISQAKAEVLAETRHQPAAEGSSLATTSEGTQFQVLDEDEDDEDVIDSELAETAPPPVAAKTVKPPAPVADAKKPADAEKPAVKASKEAEKKTSQSKAPESSESSKAAATTAESVTVTSATDGSSAEDALAKKVADQLRPSIGDKLTSQIMAKIEKSIEANEGQLEGQIKAAAVKAAEAAIAASHAKEKSAPTAKPHHSTVVTTIEHGKDGVTKTVITKTVETETSAPTMAPSTLKPLAQAIVDKDIVALEKIAVKKAAIDADLQSKEKAIQEKYHEDHKAAIAAVAKKS